MLKDRIADLRERLLKTLPADPNQISGLADRIQKLAKYDRGLTRSCDFSQAQKMRRLVILKAQAWGVQEQRWASRALDWIGALSQQRGPQAALALACFGVEHRDLGDALNQLEAARAAEAPAEEPQPEPAEAAPVKPARKKKAKAEPVEEEESDDLALDAQTQAELDALLKEAEGLKKKG